MRLPDQALDAGAQRQGAGMQQFAVLARLFRVHVPDQLVRIRRGLVSGQVILDEITHAFFSTEHFQQFFV